MNVNIIFGSFIGTVAAVAALIGMLGGWLFAYYAFRHVATTTTVPEAPRPAAWTLRSLSEYLANSLDLRMPTAVQFQYVLITIEYKRPLPTTPVFSSPWEAQVTSTIEDDADLNVILGAMPTLKRTKDHAAGH